MAQPAQSPRRCASLYSDHSSLMTKNYDILLDETKIGTTELEKADALMGIVFGKIKLYDIL